MPRRTSATVTSASHNPAPPVRESAENREPAAHSPAWGLYLSIALVVLSLGGGGIATLLSLLGAQLPASTQYAVMVLTSLSAVALSGFIIKGLGEIKVDGVKLLNNIGPVESKARGNAETNFGSGLRAYRLAQAGQASAILAVASNAAMLATTVARTKTDHAELLSLGWLVANALLTSGSNLAGFILFTTLGARNGCLLAKVHDDESKASKKRISELEEKLIKAGIAVPSDASEPAPIVATDLFRRRSSVQTASADVDQQPADDFVPVAGSIGALPIVPSSRS